MIFRPRARILLGSWLLAVVTLVGAVPTLIGCEGNGGGTPCEQDNPDQGENCG